MVFETIKRWKEVPMSPLELNTFLLCRFTCLYMCEQLKWPTHQISYFQLITQFLLSSTSKFLRENLTLAQQVSPGTLITSLWGCEVRMVKVLPLLRYTHGYREGAWAGLVPKGIYFIMFHFFLTIFSWDTFLTYRRLLS